MKRQVLATLAVGLLLGTDALRAEEGAREIEKAIRALNEAFVSRNAETIRRLMTEDHQAVTAYYGGPADRAEQIKGLADTQLTEYSPGKMKITLLGKDTALVTYALAQKGTFKGRPVAARSFASALWVRRDGKWLEAFYQETPLEGK